jgi:hypothetical protein
VPTELVLLSDIEPTTTVIVAAAAPLHPAGRLLEYRQGQVRQFLDVDGHPLLQVFGTFPVHEPRAAAAGVVDPPSAFGLWTDVTIPYGDATAGRAVAQAIADAVGGRLADRA